jgi:hypothetical protein
LLTVSSIKPSLASLAVFLLGGLGLTIFAPPASGAPGGESASWTVSTAPNQYGSGRPLYSYTAKAGESLTDGIDIANQDAEPITLKLYAADGFTTDSGGFDILTQDKPSKDLGTWVKPSVSSVTIAAGRTVQVPFQLTVPANATPGDHMGGIVTVLDQNPDGTSGSTTVHRRVGLRIKVRVGGELAPRLEIENFKLDFVGTSNPFGTGNAIARYTVRNTGNTLLSGLQNITVSGAFGRSPRTIDGARLPQLLPGESWDVKVPVDNVRGLLWVSSKVSVTPVLTDAASSTSTLNPVTASAHSSSSIWSYVLIITVIVMLAALVWLLVRRLKRRRHSGPEESVNVVQAKVPAE